MGVCQGLEPISALSRKRRSSCQWDTNLSVGAVAESSELCADPFAKAR